MKRWLPVIILLVLMLSAHVTGLSDYLNFEELRNHRNSLKDLVSKYPYAAPISYILIYFLLTSLSFPGAVFVTLTGGFLFPQPYSTLYTMTGATLGATTLFLIARYSTEHMREKNLGSMLQKIEKGLKENAASYLLFLRLIPLFPFWVVNLAPALFGVPLKTFIWTTIVGIIPGTFVFTQAGSGLDEIFNQSESISIHSILNTKMKLALVALGLFALMPILLKKLPIFKKYSS